jgi:hypothetical protein
LVFASGPDSRCLLAREGFDDLTFVLLSPRLVYADGLAFNDGVRWKDGKMKNNALADGVFVGFC